MTAQGSFSTRPTPEAKQPKWSPLAMAALVLLTILLLVVLTDRALFYIVGLGDALLIQSDPSTNYILKPNQHVRRFFVHTDINQHGMRSPDFTPTRPPGTYRVLLIGDSMTYGTTQVDQKAIFSSLLAAELPAQLHEPVEILNGSAGAWAIGNELGYLKSRGTFDANLVVLVLNSGDIGQIPATFIGLGGDASTVKPACALCEVWVRYLRPKFFHTHEKMDAGTSLITENSSQAIEQNLHWLDNFYRVTQQDHVPMAMVFLAMRAYIPDNAPSSAPARLVQWTQDHHVPLVDVTPAETRFSPKSITKDGLHFNKEGHRVTAAYLEQQWKDLDPGAVAH